MSKNIVDFLKEAGVFFIATEDGDQARVRPFGLVFEHDNKVYFGVGDFKPSYKQLKENSKFEISAVRNQTEWIRITANAVFDDSPKLQEKAFKVSPGLRDLYSEYSGKKLALFYADNVEAWVFNLSGKKEEIH